MAVVEVFANNDGTLSLTIKLFDSGTPPLLGCGPASSFWELVASGDRRFKVGTEILLVF